MRRNAVLLFLLLSLSGYSQIQINGLVTNEKDSALLGVNVSVYELPDTSFVDGVITHTSGNFKISLNEPGSYQVLFSYVGYRIQVKELEIKEDETIDLGTTVLVEDDELLDEVEIKDRIVRVEMNGDTVEFNTNAYKLNKSALLEDLIKQLPGVTYENGQLQANGEPVTRITIDGQDFFGDDILIALKNLPAEMIAKVQLFNKEDDEDQQSGGSKEQGINLVTKEGMNKGIFGRLEGGVGTDNRYQIDGMVNFFKPNTRLSLFFISNNINQQNFNYQEVTSTTEQGYESFYDLYSGDDNGIATTSAIGINFNQKLKGKNQIGFSYLLNKKDVANDKRSNQQFFINDSTSQNYYEESIFRKSTFQQIFTTNFEWKKDSTQSLRFRPQLTIQSQGENNGISAVNSFNEGVQLNELMSVLQTNHQNIETKGELRYNYKFKNKKGRRFNTRIDYQYQKNNSEYELNSQNTFFLSDSTDYIDQLSESVSDGYNVNANLYYNEPIVEGLSLNFGLSSSYRNDVSNWETNLLNPNTNIYEIPDYNLTNLFERNESKISPSASLRFGNDTISGWAGFRSEWSQLYLSQEIPENTSLNNQFLNPLPYAGFRFSKGKAFRIALWYYTRTQLPSTTQLQPIVNNVNPLFLTVGNPNLDRAYVHQIGLNLSGYNKKNSQSYSAYFHYTHTLSYIGQNRVWANADTIVNDVNVSQGSQYTVYQNYGHAQTMYAYLSYTIPIDVIGSNLSFKATGNYRSFPGEINGEENKTENLTPNAWVNLYTNFSETFQLGLNGGFSLNYSQNTLQQQSNILTSSYFAGLETEWQPEFGLRIEADINYSTNKGLSESFNLNSWMINGEIGYQFLEEKTLGISLGVYDLLNQNIGIFRNVTDMQINDISNTVLTQFCYVKLSWQLRYFKDKKKEE